MYTYLHAYTECEHSQQHSALCESNRGSSRVQKIYSDHSVLYTILTVEDAHTHMLVKSTYTHSVHYARLLMHSIHT
jgi:hypothetical protein